MTHAPTPSVRHRLAALGGMLALLAGCASQSLPPYSPQPLPRLPAPAAPATAPAPAPSVPVEVTPVPDRAPQARGPDAHLVTLAADLSSAEVIPPTYSAASGRVVAVYNADTGLLRWKANYNGLGVPTGISFNGPADVDQNAAAMINWPTPYTSSGYEGRATLNREQATDMLGGLWYVIVRTPSHPEGELRGRFTVRN